MSAGDSLIGFAARREGARMAKFGGVGLANTATDFFVYGALLSIGAPALGANAAGFFAANAQSYLLNSRFTFHEGCAPARVSLAGYGKFLLAHLISLAISSAMIAIFADRWGALPAKASATLFTFLWNYSMSAIFVFGAKRRAATGAEAAP